MICDTWARSDPSSGWVPRAMAVTASSPTPSTAAIGLDGKRMGRGVIAAGEEIERSRGGEEEEPGSEGGVGTWRRVNWRDAGGRRRGRGFKRREEGEEGRGTTVHGRPTVMLMMRGLHLAPAPAMTCT